MKQENSFTLIEILVVIVVIGILSAFILVGLSSITGSANIAKGQAYMNSIRNSLLVSLVTEWKLDENTGATTKDSWNNLTGTWYGSASANWRPQTECVSGYCLLFDGVDDYIEMPNVNNTPLYNITSEITISAWFKRMGASGGTADASYHGIVRGVNGDGWRPRLLVSTAGGAIYFEYRNSTTNLDESVANTVSLNFDINKWHYMTATKGSYGVRIYFDGKMVGENAAYTGPIKNGSSAFSIGCGATPIIHFMTNGAIDSVLIYSSAIPSSKIQENYYSGLNSLYLSSNNSQEYVQRIGQLKEIISKK